MKYPDEWNPIFNDDMAFDFKVDPIGYMRHMVFKRNESWDASILGFRGGGKSTIGLSMMLLMNPKLVDMNPKKALNKCWAFTTADRNEKKSKLRRGDALAMDEQGTKHSGSSYKWSSDENQQLADSKQVDRVDGVWEVGITLDEMRVVKRVRNLARVIIYPETKLTSKENKDIGMGIDCIFREVKENPFATNDRDKIKPRYFKYSDGGRIARVTIPLPPMEFWNEYMVLRREFKDSVDNEEVPNAVKDKWTEEKELDEVTALYQQQLDLKRRINKIGK
ncbi:MAG: hypothetical protein P1P69_04140 [Methanosarcinaceae archaeon]|nr:hypothetical protein [Methanosarcinaceae archaeon]